MLLCQGTLIFSIPIPLHSRADCCMLYPEIQGAESKPCISHVPCFLCWEAGRALGTAGLSAMLAQPWLQASDSSIVLPYTHDSLEVGKILLLQNCPVPMAKGQGDLSRAGDSFLGHTFPGFVCFVFSWKALPHAYLVQHFKSSLLEENMLLTWSKLYTILWYVKLYQRISTVFSKIQHLFNAQSSWQKSAKVAMINLLKNKIIKRSFADVFFQVCKISQ